MAFLIRSWHSVFFYLLLCTFFTVINATVVPSLPLSFTFDWTPEGQSPPIPISEQCETLHIKWDRGSTTGPNPVAPYFLQVYSSNSTVPYIIPAGDQLSFDWQVPSSFIPGTQYQICMFDINGNTGGCQAIFTVISPTGTTADCAPLPNPPALDVNATVDIGQLSRFGFMDQCTDISLRPKNGVPPYTMTVAPALHPPFNLTSKDDSPLNWTITLSWASPFFISMFDSNGSSWSAGPLHSGGPGRTTSCLTAPQDQPAKGVKHGTAALMTVAALLSGIIGGVLFLWVFLKYRRRRQEKENATHPHAFPSGFESATQTSEVGFGGSLSRNTSARAEEAGGGAVYVVHRDNGSAPIEVFVGERERVFELPPGYETRPGTELMRSGSGNKRTRVQNPTEPESPPESVRRKPLSGLHTIPGRKPGLPDRPNISRNNSFMSVSSDDPFATWSRAEASSSRAVIGSAL